MSELYFRLGDMKGFTPIDVADKKEGYANPIRELLQNSLDATREAKKDTCEVKIYIETISKSDIPHIQEYEEVLEKAIQTAVNQGSFNANSEQRVRPIKNALNKNDLKVLMFSDDGIGMEKKKIDAILTGGVSIKGDEKSGGSFGVGNLSSYSLSSLRYVLYATKYKDENRNLKQLFTGSPILAGHVDENGFERSNRGRIINRLPAEEGKSAFEYPEKFPDFIDSKMKDIDTGTMVAILGLSENWGEDAEYDIVSNFFHAIAHGKLDISVIDNKNQNNISEALAKKLIFEKRDRQRKSGDSILSGKFVYQAWQAVNGEGCQKDITIKNSETNFETVHVCIKNDANFDSAIVLVRNGMVVARHDSMLSREMDTLRKNKKYEPFTAVIDVDKGAPNLFRLVKGAESPYHNKLQAKVLAQSDERQLKNLLANLSEGIKEHLNEIERVSYVLPLFPLPDKSEESPENEGRAKGQVGKAKPTPPEPKPPKPKPPKPTPGPTPPRPKPVGINRNLRTRSAVRYEDCGTHFVVNMNVIPNAVDASDDVYLSIYLAEDNDRDKARTYLDFTAVSVNGAPIAISNNKAQVKLGSFKQSEPHKIVMEVQKPAYIRDVKVALSPIFGLKKRKEPED